MQKLDETVKCPYCNQESNYVFYVNTDSLTCHSCDKEFNIKIKYNPVIVSKPKRKRCIACDTVFIDNQEKFQKCPNCDLIHEHCEWD